MIMLRSGWLNRVQSRVKSSPTPRPRRGDGQRLVAADVALLESRTLLAAPQIDGTVTGQAVNDNATVSPFASVTVTDADTGDMFARVTVLNGAVRGDFTPASATGWTRTEVGNNIVYEQYYATQANVDAAVQADINALVFEPRSDALAPGKTELTDFSIYVTDGTSSDTDIGTRVVTTSVNDAPALSGAVAGQVVNDNATIAPFSTLTVADPDTQDMFARVTITNGVVRGDFSAASTTGWTRTEVGNNIVYSRYYSAEADIGAAVQNDIQAFVFEPRVDAIKPNTTETTGFTVYVTDGLSSTTNAQTTVVTTSINNAVSIGAAVAGQAVNDDATIAPFSTLTVVDSDTQDMFARVTITDGLVRGDFSTASTVGWTRSVVGNNIVYSRYFGPQANVGATVQAAVRAFSFQPRVDALAPGLTETTNFTVYVTDGLTSATNSATSVVTTSVNNAVAIGGAVANQAVNDNATVSLFSTLTVSDSDKQDMFARVRITNGVNRGDFTLASSSGWTRTVIGADIEYTRYFNASADIGATVETAVRGLVFQPRNNVTVGTTETTNVSVSLTDGITTATNSTTSVVTTGVAPRVGDTIQESDTTTVVV
jgi:hypothetical protein